MLLSLVRHGQTDWNFHGRIQGSTDIPLNDTGRDQASATGRLLARREWDSIYSSPLSRAYETGQIIARELALLDPVTVDLIVERAYGEAEGLTDAELSARFPGDMTVPGRESREEIVARVMPALKDIAERNFDRNVLVVLHGGVIRAVLSVVTPEGVYGTIPNGSIHSLRYDDGVFSLIAFNDFLEREPYDTDRSGADKAEARA